MSIDISRRRFDAARGYHGVLMQQGRVQLDADWNEQVAIGDRRARSTAYDLFGRSAVPETTPDAFRIELSAGTLRIGPGRMYVDGLQAENHGAGPTTWDRHLGERVGTQPVAYDAQPWLPFAGAEAPLPTGPGTHLVYLDVWQREVNHLVDPELVEPAVGVDTTARAQTVWQVRVLADVGDVTCATPDGDVPGWDEATGPSAGRLSTSARSSEASDEPCLLPPGPGFKGLENHTYRVEIHDPGVPLASGVPSDPLPAGTATFKWSRDNGAVAAEVVALPALDRVRVSSLGRDEFLRFRDGDWVEVTDNVRELHGRPGFLSRISIDEAHEELVLETALPAGAFPVDPADHSTDPERRTRVRRWDQGGLVRDTSGQVIVDLNAAGAGGAIPVPPAGTPIELEAGVVATFETPPGGIARAGDHWIFVARTVDGSVEELSEAPPHGVHHHYTRLALIHQPEDGEPELSDCRHPWGCDCTGEITVAPGRNVQAAVDALPARGGRVRLGAGVHRLRRPLRIDGRRHVVVEGCGRGSLLLLDRRDGPETRAVVHVAGGSRDVRLEELSIYSERSASLVAVHGGSAEVRVARAALVNASEGNRVDGVLAGACSEVAVEGCRLLARRGVAQASPDDLEMLAAELRTLRGKPAPEDEEAGDPDIREDAAARRRAGLAEPLEPIEDLRVEHNLILATEVGVALEDVRGARIARNRIEPALDRIHDLRRPERDESTADGEESASTDRRAAAPDGDAFLDQLHEAFDELVGAEVDDEDLALLDVGIEAVMAEKLRVEGNEVRAAVGCRLHHSRRATVRDNDLRAAVAGVATTYAFVLAVEENRIVVRADDPPRRREDRTADLGSPEPGASGVALDFTRGVRLSRNDIEAPSGIVVRSASRPEPVAAGSGPALLRVLGVTKLWRAVVEFGWIVLQMVRMLGSAPSEDEQGGADPAGRGPTRAEFERDLLERWSRFLAGDEVPAFLGKAVVEDNRLCVTRYGLLARQIGTFGGVEVVRNRVTGARFTGIEVQPLFSVGLVDRIGGWIRCLFEGAVRVLRLLHDALSRFLDGVPIPETPGAADNLTAVAVTAVSGFMSLCARMGQTPTAPGGSESGNVRGNGDGDGGRSAAEGLRDALGSLLDGSCWIDDFLGGAYRISDNTVRGGGTGIQAGVDGTRVDGNRVIVHPDDPVAREAVFLGLILSGRKVDPTTEALARALIDLDRDLLLFALLNAQSPLPAPEGLLDIVGTMGRIVAETSPIRPEVEALEHALASGADADAAWRTLLAAIWRELRGYGIVLVGGDFVCVGNRVSAEEPCQRLTLVAEPNQAALAPRTDLGKPPAVGGIWHFQNVAGLLADVARLPSMAGVPETRAPEAGRSTTRAAVAVLLFHLLEQARGRTLEVRDNEIRRALVHGISTRSAIGLEWVDLSDNAVHDAGRIGIRFHGTLGTVRVQGNSVRRGGAVYGFLGGWQEGDFASLIEVVRTPSHQDAHDVAAETTLVTNNHGEGRMLQGNGTHAIRVADRSVGVFANHVRTDAAIAFRVHARSGLFTDNLSNVPNDVTAAIVEAPNRTHL